MAQKELLFEKLVNEIINLQQSKNFVLERTASFDIVKNERLVCPQDGWHPKFSPQVTIQHPLEFTIPLYFGLFGGENFISMPLAAALPNNPQLFNQLNKTVNLDDFKNNQDLQKNLNDYESKINGLVFLQALTMVQMTPLPERGNF